MSEPTLTHKHLNALLEVSKQLLDIFQGGEQSTGELIEFYALRAQVDTTLSTILDPQHHGLVEIRGLLSIPTSDVMIRIVGLLQGCVDGFEAGILKEFPPMPLPGFITG